MRANGRSESQKINKFAMATEYRYRNDIKASSVHFSNPIFPSSPPDFLTRIVVDDVVRILKHNS